MHLDTITSDGDGCLLGFSCETWTPEIPADAAIFLYSALASSLPEFGKIS